MPDPWTEVDLLLERLRRTDLRPSPTVDALFGRLVELALSAADPPALRDTARLADVHDVCSRGEALLERHWAERVVADPGSIAGFPYLGNYRRLVRGEYLAVRRVLGRRPRSVLVAGSGPLPLTAVELHRLDPALRITCLDSDGAALDLGRRVARVLCPGSARLDFRHADVADVDCSGHDVVLVAALVGLTGPEKAAVLRAVCTTLRPDALLVARSVPADGRRLLYPEVRAEELADAVEVVDVWTPPPDVVNSLVLLRRRPREAPEGATVAGLHEAGW